MSPKPTASSIRNIPFWLDRAPSSRRGAFPRLKGGAETSVVIIGGGLTGCACAWSFAAAGVKVIVLEADEVGASAAAGIGLVREDFDASFQQTSDTHGLRPARALWQAMHRASLDFPAALRRLKVRCDLASEDLVLFTRGQAEAAKRLRREYQHRRDAGLEHTWVTPAALTRETAIQTGGGIRTRGAALDPYRGCLGLALAASARGAALFERSAARRIRVGRSQVEVVTDTGTVKAEAVIVATGAPLADLRALRRHLKARSGYTVITEPLPAAVRKEAGRRATALRDTDVPPHLLRWIPDDRVLFSGGDQDEVLLRLRPRALVQRTGQLMYELSTLYPAISGLQPQWAWDFVHYETVDRLPFVGLHRNFPRHLFAMGSGRHGAGFAWLASRILLRQYLGQPAKGDEWFGFTRVL